MNAKQKAEIQKKFKRNYLLHNFTKEQLADGFIHALEENELMKSQLLEIARKELVEKKVKESEQ